MNCEHCRQLISALVDKELTEGERGSLDEHLAQCSECAQYPEQIRELERLTSEWESSAMPSEVEEAILSRTNRQQSLWRRLFGGNYHIPRPLAWAAALALLFLAIDAARGPSNAGDPGYTRDRPAITRPAVQKIVLTEADIVRTYTTQSVSEDL